MACDTTEQSTRAWASVQNAQSQILSHANCYQRAWQALKCIRTPENLSIYKKLDKKDLVIIKDIRQNVLDTLAWFWHIGPNQEQSIGK